MTAALPVAALCRRCRVEELPFASTTELAPLEGALGQERATAAISFGAAMRGEGYNLFALGPTGCGKHALVRELLGATAAASPTPPDWCYVSNFDDPARPRALRLPSGRARAFAQPMSTLVDELRLWRRTWYSSSRTADAAPTSNRA